MADLVRIPLDDGGSVLVEDVRPHGQGPVRVSRVGDVIKEASGSIGAVLVPVRQAAAAALEELRKARPDEVEVEFGVCFTAEAGAVITKTEAGAHLTVKLVWRREEGGGTLSPAVVDPTLPEQ